MKNTVVNLANIDKDFFATMVDFHKNYVERVIIKKVHTAKMKELNANLKKAKDARTDLEKDSIVEESKAISREKEAYKKVVKPYNDAIREVLKTVPDKTFEGYEYAVKEGKYGRLIDSTEEFLLSAGIVEKDAGTIKRFSQSIINSIGKKRATIDDMVKSQSYFKALSKTPFKELYLLSFLEMCNKNGVAKVTFSAETTNEDVLKYIGKTVVVEPTSTVKATPTPATEEVSSAPTTVTAESSYNELRKALKAAGLSTKGKKDELVKRCEENGLFDAKKEDTQQEAEVEVSVEPTTNAAFDKKYELTEESIDFEGTTLHRIRAIRSFNDVKAGDLGGFIEKESNLSHGGNAWVYDRARVYGKAKVSGDARIYDKAQVYHNAKIYDKVFVLLS